MLRPVFTTFIIWLLVTILSSPVAAVSRGYVDKNNQAVELMENGEYLEGIELLKKSLANAPYDEVIQQNLLFAYRNAGWKLKQQERFAELAELMLEAQEYDDSQREFWILRGYSLYLLKEYYEAETDLQEARAMGEPDAWILYLLGQLYYDTDRMDEAFDVLESAQMHDSDNHAVAGMLEKVRRELAVEQDMEKEYGGHFVITYDGDQNDDLGQDVLEVLEEAYNWIGSQLDHYPDDRVTVILYSRQQFSELTDSPEWAGGLFDGKIRLPVGGISRLDDNVRALLYHEYMHVVLHDIAGINLPFWLGEGLAEVAEAEVQEPNLNVLSLAREQEKLFRLKTLEKPFEQLSGMRVPLAYQQSYSVVRYLIDEYGWYHVRDLVFALADGVSIEQAIEDAMGVYGLTYSSLERQWRGSG